MPEILFICTGNTCRSPMAEYLLRDILDSEGIIDWKIQSAGISALSGLKASEKADQVLQEEGINLSGHQSRQVNEELLIKSDLILTMTSNHKKMLLEIVPTAREKIYTLKEFAGVEADSDIFDPYGQTIDIYRKTRDEIKNSLTQIIVKLAQFVEKAGKKENLENINIRSGKMKIAIGSDHAGYDLKEEIKELLQEKNIKFEDMGTDSYESVDYPDFAYKVATAVAEDQFDKGILICGTGIGMSISANKIKGVRAALCHDIFSAKATRNHNDANVLTMGSRVIGSGLAREIVKEWLGTSFNGGRHERRVGKINKIERGDY